MKVSGIASLRCSEGGSPTGPCDDLRCRAMVTSSRIAQGPHPVLWSTGRATLLAFHALRVEVREKFIRIVSVLEFLVALLIVHTPESVLVVVRSRVQSVPSLEFGNFILDHLVVVAILKGHRYRTPESKV